MGISNSSSPLSLPITSSPRKIRQHLHLTILGWITLCAWIGSWIVYAFLGPYYLILVFLISLLIVIGGWEYDSAQRLSIKLQFTDLASEDKSSLPSKNATPIEAKIILFSLGAFPIAPLEITLNGYFPSENHPLAHTLKSDIMSKRQTSLLYLPLHFSTSGTLCIQTLSLVSTGFLKLFNLSITYREDVSLTISHDSLALLNSKSAISADNPLPHLSPEHMHKIEPDSSLDNSPNAQLFSNSSSDIARSPSSQSPSPYSSSSAFNHGIHRNMLPSDNLSLQNLWDIISCSSTDYTQNLSPFTFLARSSRLTSNISGATPKSLPVYIPPYGSLSTPTLSEEPLSLGISMNDLLPSHTVIIPSSSHGNTLSHTTDSDSSCNFSHASSYVPLFSLASDNETSFSYSSSFAHYVPWQTYKLCIFIDRQNTDYQTEDYYKEAQNIARYISVYSAMHQYPHILTDGNFYEYISTSSDYLPHLQSVFNSFSSLPLLSTAPMGQSFVKPLQLAENFASLPYLYTVIITGDYCPINALESYSHITKNPLPLTYIQIGSQEMPHVSSFSQFSVIHVQSWEDLQLPLSSHILKA